MHKTERFQQLISTRTVRENLRGTSVRAAIFTGTAGFGDFLIRIGSTAALARLLVPEHFGVVMIAMAITSIAEQFRDLGLSTATVQREEISHEEVSNLFWINVGISGGLALIVCAAAPLVAHYYKDPRLTAVTFVLALNLVFGGLMVQHQALLTRQLKLGQTSALRLVASVVSTILAIALAWWDFSYWALVWREVARSALLSAGMWLCLPWIPGLPCRQTDVRGLLGFGANLTCANIISTLTAAFDRLLIGRFWGAGPVGIYRQGYQLMAAPTDQLVSPIYQVAQPGLSMLQADPARFRRFYHKVVTMVCIITMPLSLFVAVYAREITLLLLGPKWEAVVPILLILSIGTFAKQAVGSAAIVLIARGQSQTYLGLTIAQNVTLMLFICIGVRWGITGVAIADVAATYLLIAPKLFYSFRASPISISLYLRAIFRPVIASIAMATALILLRFEAHFLVPWASVFIGAAAGSVIFGATWLLIPGGKDEVNALVLDVRAGLRKKGVPLNAARPVPAAN